MTFEANCLAIEIFVMLPPFLCAGTDFGLNRFFFGGGEGCTQAKQSLVMLKPY